jgi:hypothetical protein
MYVTVSSHASVIVSSQGQFAVHEISGARQKVFFYHALFYRAHGKEKRTSNS